jgi:hypothetical protein
MTIAAILDMDQAIEIFRGQIAGLLELKDLKDWDGVRLQEQEKGIRAMALELGGQVIAQLLHDLSESKEAQQIARERTAGSRGFASQSQGKRSLTVRTLGNVEVRIGVDYQLNRSPRPGLPQAGRKARKRKQRGTSKGQGFYPLLGWLGMVEGVSPLVWSTIAEFGMLSSSFAVARLQLVEWGIDMSEQRLERLTYCFGQASIDITAAWMKQVELGEMPVGETLRLQRVVLQADGGRTRLRRNKKGKRRANGRRGYHGEWREPKLFTLYVVDDEGKRVNSLKLPVTNDGTFGDVEAFMALLEMYLVKLGIVYATEVLVIADGAPWIWQRLPALLERLGLAPEKIIELIDFYHAANHLKTFADLAFSDQTTAKQWFEAARSRMKHKSFKLLLEQMVKIVQGISGKAKRIKLIKKLTYFSEQPERFDYPRVLALKLPIGSGAIESLIRQVVNLRLKGAGKFWLPENAEIILHGRCQWAAGQWDAFSRRVLTAGIDPRPISALDINTHELMAA